MEIKTETLKLWLLEECNQLAAIHALIRGYRQIDISKYLQYNISYERGNDMKVNFTKYKELHLGSSKQ
jgi:hypothetical protein